MSPPDRGTNSPFRAERGMYFFLSYAHSTPMSLDVRTDADVWVSTFFEDLATAVRRRAASTSDLDIGFFDQQIPLGSDPKEVLVEALSAAEVLVPLYSPGYLSKPWSIRERESFRMRLAASGASSADQHIAPVLWIPFPSWERRPEVGEALELGGYSPEYAENGMRALCMLSAYRRQYLDVVARVARRIVRTAESSPLGPSRAPNLDDVTRETRGETAIVVAVLAPTVASLPAGRSPTGYADRSRLWQPFGARQALPAADHAASAADRLGLPARIIDLADGDDLLARYPTVLIIDPWTAAEPRGRDALRATLHALPDWVIPLVIADPDDPQYSVRGAELAREVTAMLAEAGNIGGHVVRQVKEFADIVPALVTDARRRYLRSAAVFPPPGSSPRHRLASPSAPPTPEEER